MNASTQWRRRVLAVALLSGVSLSLVGCGWIGGDPDPEALAAERLRQPPNVLEPIATERAEPSDSNSTQAAAVIDSPDAATTDAPSYLQRIDGEVVLDLGLPPSAAWAVAGRALERSGFALLSSNREAFSHAIRYDAGTVLGDDLDGDEDSGGWLPNVSASDFAFWRSEPEADLTEYRLVVAERGKGSRLRLQTPDGEPTRRAAARQVLVVLAEQLKP